MEQAIALDCSNVVGDPFIIGQCVSLDCNGRCNATGPNVVSGEYPTEAPSGEEGADTDDSGAAPLVSARQGMVLFTAGAMLSALLSYMA
jgi:hypothetical protein